MENMRLPELKSLARDCGLRNYSWMRKAELAALLKNSGRAPAPPPPPQRCTAYVTLKFDDSWRCRIHSTKSPKHGDKEIVTNERYFIMPWKMVNVDGKRVSLNEAVDEIFSNQDELTNSTYVTLKLYDKSSCKIHSAKQGDKEIVTNERYVVMPWNAVNMNGKNGENNKHITLEETVHEIISYKESIGKEHEIREAEQEGIERKHAEYYEAHMKS